MKRAYFFIILFCIILYIVNNCIFKWIENAFQEFFVCWFNDLLAPILVLSYINFRFGDNYKLNSLFTILLLCTVFCIVWEIGGLIIKQNSTFDPLDIACYYIGDLMFYFILIVYNYIKKQLS